MQINWLVSIWWGTVVVNELTSVALLVKLWNFLLIIRNSLKSEAVAQMCLLTKSVFTKATGKHLCPSLYQKETPVQVLSWGFCNFFKIQLKVTVPVKWSMKRLETDKGRWVFFDKCAFSNLGCNFCYKEEFGPPIHSVRSTFALLERVLIWLQECAFYDCSQSRSSW